MFLKKDKLIKPRVIFKETRILKEIRKINDVNIDTNFMLFKAEYY